MFVRIDPTRLIDGVKYKVDTKYDCFTGIYKKIHDKHSFSMIRGNICYSGAPIFLTNRTVYQFVSDNPQGKMERRAVNLIVRRLIGDYFEW